MNETMNPFENKQLSRALLILIMVLITGYALHVARDIFLPLALALLFKLLLDPVVDRMVSWRLPRAFAALFVLASTLTVFGGGFYLLYEPAMEWITQAPESFGQLEERTRKLREPVETANRAAEQVEQIADELAMTTDKATVVVAPKPSIGQQMLDGAMAFVGTAAITIVLLYFMLASGDSLLRAVLAMAPKHSARRSVIKLSQAIERDLSRYLVSVFLINISLGCAVGVAMWLLGMPNPALWGVLAGVMNFIPYLGSIVTFTVIGLVSLSSFDSNAAALAPPLVYAALTVIEGNFITMHVHGHRMTINPVLIFLSLLVWGWIWGPAGTLLAVPILAAIKTTMDHLSSAAIDGNNPV